MLLSSGLSRCRIPLLPFYCYFRKLCSNWRMGQDSLRMLERKKHTNLGIREVSGHKMEVLEIHSSNPEYHVLFIPGNPGVVTFYTDFLEFLYLLLEEKASLTAIGHLGHTKKNWSHGRLFSLQEQINYEMSFIEQQLEGAEVPLVLVGHSIGSYISMEIFKQLQQKVILCVGLYPFLAVNVKSSTQSTIQKLTASPILSAVVSSTVALLGMLPLCTTRFLVRKSLGSSWSSSAVDALCMYLLRYHTMRNVLYMGMTEFQQLSSAPDWAFLREKKDQIAFLFGLDDHWGPLHMYNEILNQVPGARVEVEREGHTHAFSCTEGGSLWVAHHVSSLIKDHIKVKASFEDHQ